MIVFAKRLCVSSSLLVLVSQALALEVEAISRISLATNGAEANGSSNAPDVSADGRYVAFHSDASNLVPDDTNGVSDAFRFDTVTGEMRRISVASDGTQANGGSSFKAMSADGRFLSFSSQATNLVPNDTTGKFIHDAVTGQVTADLPTSDAGVADISDDGRLVFFRSFDSNLVPGDTNGARDAFLFDRTTLQTTLIGEIAPGVQADNSHADQIAGDERYVVYRAGGGGSNEDHLFVRDLVTGAIEWLSRGQLDNNIDDASISDDGRFVSFSSAATNLDPIDNNGLSDVFVHDRQTGQRTRITDSINSLATETSGAMSAKISGDDRWIAFASDGADLVPPGATDDRRDSLLFVYDRQTEETTLITKTANGAPAYRMVGGHQISDDGRTVVFDSDSSIQVAGDTNGVDDVFMVRLTYDISAPAGVNPAAALGVILELILDDKP